MPENEASIFSTVKSFRLDYGLLLELHALTLAARCYVLLFLVMCVFPPSLFLPLSTLHPFGPSSLFSFYFTSLPPFLPPSPPSLCLIAMFSHDGKLEFHPNMQ